MITIDGSRGEGGGQILRTALAFSAVTGKSVTIANIRASRRNPGLRPQHLTVVHALAALCDAQVSGAAEGGSRVEFTPGKISGGNFHFNVGTAGSVTLVLSALMPVLANAESDTNIVVSGGTDVAWSPPVDYLANVTLPLLSKFGFKGELNLLRRGYYPAGGGRVEFRCRPAELKAIELPEPGRVLNYYGVSHAYESLARAKVAERTAKSARRTLYNELGAEAEIKKEYCAADSPGSGAVLWAETENTVLGGSFLGERGVSSEIVGGEAGSELADAVRSGGALDKHMADQIIPYLALAGGRALACEITSHTQTNVEVVRAFGFNLRVEDNIIIAEKE